MVLSDAQKEDFCDLMAARDFGSCDEHPEDFPSRDLAAEFVEDVKAKAKISDGVAARESGGSTDLSGLFASVDELAPDLQTALAAATARPPGQPAPAVAFASEAASGSGARGAVGEMDVSEENIGDAGKAAALVRERGAPSAPAARPPAEIADFLATLRAHGHGDGVCRHVAAVLRRRGHW